MKSSSLIILICIFSNVNAQGVWSQLSNFGGGNREISYWFQLGNYGYVGGGRNNSIAFDDLWQYDPATDSWSQKASKPGGDVYSPGIFVIADTAYAVSGWSGSNVAYQTVWAYIITTNSWIQRNNFPGTARYSAVSFALNGKGYFGTGYAPYTNDLWEYSPATDSWVQKQNFPGNVRQHGVAVSANGKAYFGLGYDGSSYNDWWESDTTFTNWIAKSNFPGAARRGAMYFEMNSKVYVAAGYDDISYYNDLWEYNPVNNLWTQLLPNMPASGRYSGFGFGFNGCAYIGTGSNGGVGNPNELNDVWKYCFNTGIDESQNHPQITISPNPSNGNIEINFKENFSNAIQFEVYSTEGKKIFSKLIVANQKTVRADLKNLPNGIYFYSLKSFKRENINDKLIILN